MALDQRTTLVWVLFMLLFMAINVHAAVYCYQTLCEEWHWTKTQRQLSVRKRRRAHFHTEHLGLVITSDHAAVAADPATVLATRLSPRKRRRLVYYHHLTPRTLRREATPWPWPVHISFHSLSDNREPTKTVGSVVTAFLNNHLVVAGVEKLQDLLRNALEEMLVSCLSFVLCACVVVLLRTYSSLVVGVSVDLGAFSVDI